MQLASQQCQGKASLITADEITDYMGRINKDWQLANENTLIRRSFKFKNYYETMAFANVVAMIAHQQDHHPEMIIRHNHCTVEYSTHSVGGLSAFDFICAAKIDSSLPF
jgi:4a-hydroxytetrahydrobiopterin dehydratase